MMTIADEVIEIRAVQPPGRLPLGLPAVLQAWRMRAEPRDGTLRLSEDRALHRKPIERVFALPLTGRADAVTTVCVATWEYFQGFMRPRTYKCWRMLLLDRQGRVVAMGRPRDEPIASMLWPAESFAPLAQLGIRTITEWHSTARALERAHPGAAPKLMILSWRQKALIGLVAPLLLVLIIAACVYVATH
jgi:hypothetical protein